MSHDLIFFFNDTATTEIYTLSLHDALPISRRRGKPRRRAAASPAAGAAAGRPPAFFRAAAPLARSEEHTSELQSQFHLVCRLLLEKKKLQYISIERNTCQLQITTKLICLHQ